jgi:hypothetical protein
VNIIDQKLVEIELVGGLFFGGENRQETQDGFIYSVV